eukprot:6069326-Amphidinium_carterae.1
MLRLGWALIRALDALLELVHLSFGWSGRKAGEANEPRDVCSHPDVYWQCHIQGQQRLFPCAVPNLSYLLRSRRSLAQSKQKLLPISSE